MPIRPSEKARYPKDWKAISLEVRERDGHRCAWCKVPNGATVLRSAEGDIYIDPPSGEVFCAETGDALGYCRGSEFPAGRMVRIVLTVAHLDHVPENVGEPGNRPNLVALCQMHHLRYDAKHHAKNAAATRRAKGPNLDLFDALQAQGGSDG